MPKRIVILGGGVAGAEAIRRVHTHFHGDKSVSITIVDRNNHTTFIPMLHEVATGSVGARDITHPIRQIINCCLEHFHQADVKHIDLGQRIVKTSAGEVPYDYLIVALGSTNNFFGVPGAEEFTLKLKEMEDAIRLRRHLIDTFEQVSRIAHTDPHRQDALHFVIVGGGYTGVETAGQMADLFNEEMRLLYPEVYADEPKITLVQAADRILPILSESNSRKALERLERLGVNVLLNTKVVAVTKEGVSLDNGNVLRSHHVLWTSGVIAQGAEFFEPEYIEKGRVKAMSTLQIVGHPEAFVIGDIAGVMEKGGPHPQTAQAAVQQARVAADNLKALADHEPLKAFHYRHRGDLIPIGDRWAIAEIYGIKFTGFFAWWLRRTVYLQGIFSWSDRLRVVFNWTMNLFSKRDTTRL